MSANVTHYQHGDAFLVYTCSKCKCPVLYSTKVFTVVQLGSSTLEQATDYLMTKLKDDTDQCFDQRRVLINKSFNESIILSQKDTLQRMKLIQIDPSSQLRYTGENSNRGCAWFTMDDNVVCPACGNHEIWQQKNSNPEEYCDFDAENFPKLYYSPEVAQLFVKLKLQEITEHIMRTRQIPDAVQKAQHAHLEKISRKQTIQDDLKDMVAHDPSEPVIKELNALNRQLYHLRAFDFKEKKALNQQIAEKKNELESLRKRHAKLKDDLSYELSRLERDLAAPPYIACGTNGTVEVYYSHCSKAYRLVPGPTYMTQP